MGSSKQSKERAVRGLTTGLEVLRATGWCRGNFGEVEIDAVDGDGVHCAVGALRAGLHIEGLDWEPSYRSKWDAAKGWVRVNTQRRRAVDKALQALAAEVPKEFIEESGSGYWYANLGTRPMPNDDESLVIDYNDSLGPDDKHLIEELFDRAIARLS